MFSSGSARVNMDSIFLLASICLFLRCSVVFGQCPDDKLQCVSSLNCQWSDDLATCVSSLPCALELSKSECLLNTWGCNWRTSVDSAGRCSITRAAIYETIAVIPIQADANAGGDELTGGPSESPTSNPSVIPTTSPSLVPSVTPSYNPSQHPTSESPSASPLTSVPSGVPSSSPESATPSLAPSPNPATSTPSQSPETSTPSSRPSTTPSQFPKTSNPSHVPSPQPSNRIATAKPSTIPVTSTPSSHPTRTTLSPVTTQEPTYPTSSPRSPTTVAPTEASTTPTPSDQPTVSASSISLTLCGALSMEHACRTQKTCHWHNEQCKRKPTIVLSVSDDLGWNDVPWRNRRVRMPVIERLRNQGVELNRYYSSRFCAPTRAMLMTGRYPWRMGLQTDLNLNPALVIRCGVPVELPMLPQLLQESGGYRTHAFGKWHLGYYRDDLLPTARGYDTFIGYFGGGVEHHMKPHQFISDRCACPSSVGRGVCNQYNAKQKMTCAYGVDMVNSTKGGGVTAIDPANVQEDITDLFLANRARDTILSTADDDPLFLYLAWSSPHSPVASPERYKQSLRASMPTWGTDAMLNRVCSADYRFTHVAMLSVLDDAHRIVINALDAVDRFNSAIFIFVSDNGGNSPRQDGKKPKLTSSGCGTGSNYPLRGSKFTWFEGGIRSSGFISSPDFIAEDKKGTVYQGLIAATDWMSTIMTAVGASTTNTPEDSVSLWTAISQRNAKNFNSRTQLPLQVWNEQGRFVVLYYVDDVLYKLIQGYPWRGTGAGSVGKPIQNYAHSDIFQPWELPNSEVKFPTALGNDRKYMCAPYCLFNLDADIQEFNELSKKSLTPLRIGQAFINAYSKQEPRVDSSKLCEAYYYAENTRDTTDSYPLAKVKLCGFYEPWVFANYTRKPLTCPDGILSSIVQGQLPLPPSPRPRKGRKPTPRRG